MDREPIGTGRLPPLGGCIEFRCRGTPRDGRSRPTTSVVREMSDKCFSVLMLALALIACAKIDINPSSPPTLKEGRSIELGRDTEATVGSVVYSEYNYYAAQSAVTRTP